MIVRWSKWPDCTFSPSSKADLPFWISDGFAFPYVDVDCFGDQKGIMMSGSPRWIPCFHLCTVPPRVAVRSHKNDPQEHIAEKRWAMALALSEPPTRHMWVVAKDGTDVQGFSVKKGLFHCLPIEKQFIRDFCGASFSSPADLKTQTWLLPAIESKQHLIVMKNGLLLLIFHLGSKNPLADDPLSEDFESINLVTLWPQFFRLISHQNTESRLVLIHSHFYKFVLQPKEYHPYRSWSAKIALHFFDKLDEEWLKIHFSLVVNALEDDAELSQCDPIQSPWFRHWLKRVFDALAWPSGSFPISLTLRLLVRYLNDHPNLRMDALKLVLLLYPCLMEHSPQTERMKEEFLPLLLMRHLQGRFILIPSLELLMEVDDDLDFSHFMILLISSKQGRSLGDVILSSFPFSPVAQRWRTIKNQMFSHCPSS